MTMRINEWIKKVACHVVMMFILSCPVISCKPDLSDDAIPWVDFPSVVINTNLPEYQQLKTQGYVEINGIGVRGVILRMINNSTYVAYERNCSYQPNDACATVNVHISGLYLTDPCCNSTFDFATGEPTGGVAWRPLNKYETIVSGSQVTITSLLVD